LVARDGGETLIDRLPLLLAHAGPQDDNVINARELVFEDVEVVISLRQEQRRTRIANRVDDVFADSPSTCVVVDQLLVERLKFDTFVRIRGPRRLECCRLNEHEVVEGARCRLCAGIYLMPNRAALHKMAMIATKNAFKLRCCGRLSTAEGVRTNAPPLSSGLITASLR
jgi:hypothetical protein